MSATNSNLTGDNKAVEATERQKERPEEAVHHELKNEEGADKSKD
ncbi:hypothetical protein SAMN05428995_101308 [Loktanella sp. DSM 29012]|nr:MULTISPECIES: hypothetical protein [Loktanella]SEP62177.1 hypothetical protein SAMN05428995_101308 [Loktanella sp. DSM 29012]